MKIQHLIVSLLIAIAKPLVAQQDSSKVSLRITGSVNNSFTQLRAPTVGWGVGGGAVITMSPKTFLDIILELNQLQLFSRTFPFGYNISRKMSMTQLTLPINVGVQLKPNCVYFSAGSFFETTVAGQFLKSELITEERFFYGIDETGLLLGGGINLGLEFRFPARNSHVFLKPEIRGGFALSNIVRLSFGVQLK